MEGAHPAWHAPNTHFPPYHASPPAEFSYLEAESSQRTTANKRLWKLKLLALCTYSCNLLDERDPLVTGTIFRGSGKTRLPILAAIYFLSNMLS